MTEASRSHPESHGHRLEIDGLGALTVLLVIAFQWGLTMLEGFVRIDMFFVISYFLIGSNCESELRPVASLSMGSMKR